jgi:hypothetical protein
MSLRPTSAGCLRRAHRTFCLVWATICLLVTVATAEAETYYVHATNGDDRNAGTRAGAPWQTLGRVNAQRLQPGDRVLLASGERFTGQLAGDGLAGTAEKPIVFASYPTTPDHPRTGPSSMAAVRWRRCT